VLVTRPGITDDPEDEDPVCPPDEVEPEPGLVLGVAAAAAIPGIAAVVVDLAVDGDPVDGDPPDEEAAEPEAVAWGCAKDPGMTPCPAADDFPVAVLWPAAELLPATVLLPAAVLFTPGVSAEPALPDCCVTVGCCPVRVVAGELAVADGSWVAAWPVAGVPLSM
jgi:hypothetical protein